jgi:hypothetical protein
MGLKEGDEIDITRTRVFTQGSWRPSSSLSLLLLTSSYTSIVAHSRLVSSRDIYRVILLIGQTKKAGPTYYNGELSDTESRMITDQSRLDVMIVCSTMIRGVAAAMY